MTVYALTGPITSGHTIIRGAKNAIVHAPSEAVAKRIAGYHVAGMNPRYYEDATENMGASAAVVQKATNWLGWTLKAKIVDTNGAILAEASVLAAGSNDTIDEIAAAFVTAINATAAVSNAAYNSSTNVLSVAGASDNLGAKRLFVDMIPPGKTKAVNSMLGSITHQGSAGAALTVALPADNYAIPAVIAKFKAA